MPPLDHVVVGVETGILSPQNQYLFQRFEFSIRFGKSAQGLENLDNGVAANFGCYEEEFAFCIILTLADILECYDSPVWFNA